jgi:hypothetical protein
MTSVMITAVLLTMSLAASWILVRPVGRRAAVRVKTRASRR